MILDLSNASRIPNAPVHRVSPPKLSQNSNSSSNDSDSDSDSYNYRLQINQNDLKKHKKNESQHPMESIQTKPIMQQQQQQMPFIRPDHTLLPEKRISLTPSPPADRTLFHSPPMNLPSTSHPFVGKLNETFFKAQIQILKSIRNHYRYSNTKNKAR